MEAAHQRLEQLASRPCLKSPQWLLDERRNRLVRAGAALDERMRSLLLRVETRVEGLARRVEQRSPGLELERRASRLDLAAARLPAAVRQRLERLSSRLDSSARALEAVSPVAVLARGYSITFVEGSTTPLTDANAATNGDTLVTRLSHGELRSRVETTS